MSDATAIGTGPRASLACVPVAIPAAERPAHFALVQRLFQGAVGERLDAPNGYAFTLTADVFAEVARFIDNERRCCPFLNFALELTPDGGPLWLRITGPAETRAFLNAELLGIRDEPA